jgi:DeoR/GlpR family transcriptional regulator of sugar metabolism
MLAKHRQSLILQDVRRAGSARVSDLTERLGVSDMTIRRDLEVLARAGLIEKVHGGAVLPGAPSSHEPGFEAKSVLERPEKEAIARAAAALVTPGTAIALSAGTTTFELARHLREIPRLTDLAIRSLHFDLLFLGCHGIDPVAGLTTPNLAESETNRAFVRAARRVMVIADHTKWGIVGLSSFADLEDVDTLITDSDLPEEARVLLADRVSALVICSDDGTAAGGLRQPGAQRQPG